MPRNDLIQLRSDTAANWVSVNPTLAVGETGFETDTGKLKVGTGSSDWNSLIYVTDASDLAGIIPSARISGSYTGITGLGTLTSLTIDGPSSTSFTLGDTGFAGYSGVQGDKGYLLVGNSVGDPDIYLRNSGAGGVSLGGSNSNTLQVGNGTVTVVGTMNATTFSGSGSSLTSLPAGQLTGTVASARISGSYTGITGLGTLTSLTVAGTMYATTFSGALSGNASTATNLSTDRTNWSTNGTISAVVGQLGWKNYGGFHTIFDASQSTSPNGGAVNNTNAQFPWTGTYPTLMGWNGANTYGVRVDSARTADIASSVGTLSSLSVSGALNAYSISGNSNVAGTGNASYHPSGVYSTGTNWLYGNVFLNGNDIGDTSSTVTGAGQIYANGWFRSWGDSGWYNQSYGGGIWMTDTSFVRIYNGKIFYAEGGIWSIDTGTASTTGFQYLLRGTLYGNYAPFTSMREAKRNIETIPNSGLLIDQLNPVTFQEKITDTDDEISTAWKDADLEYGFIADEVAQVGTGHLAQYESMDDGTLKPVGWSFHGVVSVLVAEVKDLRKRLQQLEESNV